LCFNHNEVLPCILRKYIIYIILYLILLIKKNDDIQIGECLIIRILILN
jgi:hypothetical protein